MSKAAALVRSFVKEEEGATMVEYGVMVALIAAVCIAIVKTLGSQVNSSFKTVSDSLK